MNPTMPRYVQFVFALIGVYLLFHIMIVGSNILIPLSFSVLVALLLYPLVKGMEQRKIPRGLAIIIAMVGLLAVLGIIIFFITHQFIGFTDELPEMKEKLKEALVNLQTFIESRFNVTPEAQISWLEEKLLAMLEGTGDSLPGFIATTSGVVTQIGLIPIYIFFMLFYRDIFVDFFFKAAPLDRQSQVASMMTKVQQVIQNYLVGLFIVIFIVAVLNTTSLLIIGVDHAVFFGVVAALLTIIPYIGVFIGSMIPVLYSLAMTGDIWQPLWIFLAFSVVQSLEGNVITPKITGSKVSINPLAAIIALLVGASVWGVAGMIMFVPLIAMAKVVFDHIEPLQPYGLLLGAKLPDKETKERWKQMTEKFKHPSTKSPPRDTPPEKED